MRRREGLAVALSVLALCAVALGIAGRDLEVPGLYYDEVIQAEPAVQFLAEDGRPSAIPGARTIRLFGSWFPVMIQPYMGALKSQALLPCFAAFGATPASLRLTTLAWSLLGLFLAMLWTRQVLDTRTAVVAATLLAVDPSFLLISRHDWGSFALGFLCRCGGLYFMSAGWAHRSVWRLFLGGLCLGLGVYNKIDFAIFVAAAGLALVLAVPRMPVELWRSRDLRPLSALLGLLLGAAPMIVSLSGVVTSAGLAIRGQASGGNWAEKLHALTATLDGSYFHRLMLAGGSFESMFAVEGAAADLFLPVLLACSALLALRLWRDRRRGAVDPAQAFIWLTTLFTAVGIFLTPRAVRIHHILNAYPFPQLLVAIVLVQPWRRAAAPGRLRDLGRAAALAVLAAVLLSSLRVDHRTLATIRESGGKGRWSDSLGNFAEELATQPGVVAVSLDWGFDGPLRYRSRELALVEPIWQMRRVRRRGASWTFEGTPQHVYLVFEKDLAVFEFGPKFLERVREMEPGDVRIRRHVDRSGDLAFLSVRFAKPHRLVYSGEWEVSVQWRPSRSGP